ncbi:MAG TPA: hypothetical protein VF658_05465 [Pyrinomonadaceae bacterium]|jgi:hypothetical protein
MKSNSSAIVPVANKLRRRIVDLPLAGLNFGVVKLFYRESKMSKHLNAQQSKGYAVTHLCKKIDNVSLFDERVFRDYLEALNKSTSRPQVDRNNYRAKPPQSLFSAAFRTIKALTMQPRRALKNCVDVASKGFSQRRSVFWAATLVLKQTQE